MARMMPIEGTVRCPRCGEELAVVVDVACVETTYVGLSQKAGFKITYKASNIAHDCKETK